MPLTEFQKRMEPLALSYPLQTAAGNAVQLVGDEGLKLILKGLDGIYEALGAIPGVAARTPTHSVGTVTDTAGSILAASVDPRFARVTNNSASDDILILEGTDPYFFNGTTHLQDFGILLGPGDTWVSDYLFTDAVKAVAKSGVTAYVTVTEYV